MTDITFFPYITTGLGAAATDLPIDDQLQIPITLNITARPSNTTHTIDQKVGLYRPCDVIGLDPRAILRTDPDHRIMVGDFEPNYLAIVEFAAPDLPWRFTTDQAVDGRRSPWLGLVVLAEGEYDEVRSSGGSGGPRPPTIRIHEPGRVLPPSGQIGAWAHGQGAGALSSATAADLETMNSRSLTALRSRLIAARRLRPLTGYHAFLIPTFECGRLRGLNPGAVHDHTPGYAWSASAPPEQEFPVYFSWGFDTSAYGDIESLAERIEPRALDPTTGTRPLRVPKQEYEIPPTDSPMRYEGAVVSTDLEPPPEQPAATTDRLVEVLNAPALLAGADELDVEKTPAVAPPLYGQWHTRQHRIEVPAEEADPKPWLSRMNGSLAYRAAAGLGAEVIRRDQEQLVAEAWRQVGDVLTAYQRISAAQLGFLTSTRLYERTISKLPDEAVLFLSRPVHAKLRNPGDTTLLTELEESNLRGIAQSAHTRAMLAPRGAARRAFAFNGQRFASGAVVPAVAASQRIKVQFESGIVDQTLRPFIDVATTSAADEGGSPVAADADSGAVPPGTVSGDAAMTRLSELRDTPLGPVDLASIRTEVLTCIDPKTTIPTRINASIQGVEISSPAALCNPIMPAPEFETPMYATLRDISPSHILPGVGDVPQNTAALLTSNQEFLESYLAGLNYEMAAELLWRGYPTDLRATYFKHFWDSGGDFPDIAPIHTWTGELGTNRGGSIAEPLVLLLKADLALRYPGIMVYAQRASIDEPTGEYELGSGDGAIVEPIFRGDLTPDTIVVGFDLTAAQARGDDEGHGYFIVLQEQEGESRFGLDEAANPSGAPEWGETTWADVTPISHGDAGQWHGPIDLEATTVAHLPADPPWNSGAAEMAEILFQQPYRIALHGRRLLPAPPLLQP